MNILIPIAGKSAFFEKSYFPKPLYGINEIPMIRYVLSNFDSLTEVKFIFVLIESDCKKFHLDNVIRNITPSNTVILKQQRKSRGAICSSLMAIEYIDSDEPLIIANDDVYIRKNVQDIINYFNKKGGDAGVVTFNSIHPQWSYCVIKNGKVVQTAEKNPISSNAMAGLYFFSTGNSFVKAAKEVIRKSISDPHKICFLSEAMNELILEGKEVMAYEIDKNDHVSFYSEHKIEDFEKKYPDHKLESTRC